QPLLHYSFILHDHHAPRPTPFPYTTLFRSGGENARHVRSDTATQDQEDGAGNSGIAVLLLCVSRLPHSIARSRRSQSRRTAIPRSEEHTSELQSRGHLVCRLLLEKKNITI